MTPTPSSEASSERITTYAIQLPRLGTDDWYKPVGNYADLADAVAIASRLPTCRIIERHWVPAAVCDALGTALRLLERAVERPVQLGTASDILDFLDTMKGVGDGRQV